MVGSVIFLAPRPTTSWDDERWGFAALRARGVTPFSVDLSAVIGAAGETEIRTDDIRPRSIAEFSWLVASSAGSAVFIDFLRGVSGPDLKTAKIFRSLRDAGAVYYVIAGGALPTAPRKEGPLKRALSRPARALHHLWWLANRAAAERFGGYFPPARIFGPESEVVSSFAARYGIPRDRIVPSHSLDYEMLLQPRMSAETFSRACVFVDDGIAGHPDFERGDRRPANRDEYFALLRRVFDMVEKKTRLPVVIAAHPRGDTISPALIGGRRVVLGETSALVDSASLVIGHASTALGLAVLKRKPVLLLTGRHVANAGLAGAVSAVAAAIGAPVVDFDDAGAVGEFEPASIVVSEEKCSAYVARYIRGPAAADGSLWDFVAEYASRDVGGRSST